MSQELVSQRIKRTCEGCGSVREWELVNAPDSAAQEMQQYYTIVREIFSEQEGRYIKLAVQACSLACVPVAALKLAAPQVEEPADNIDLGSLRTNRIN